MKQLPCADLAMPEDEGERCPHCNAKQGDPCGLEEAWLNAVNHPGVEIRANGDDAARAWNALAARMAKR